VRQPLPLDTTAAPTSGTTPAPPKSTATMLTTVASPAGDDIAIRFTRPCTNVRNAHNVFPSAFQTGVAPIPFTAARFSSPEVAAGRRQQLQPSQTPTSQPFISKPWSTPSATEEKRPRPRDSLPSCHRDATTLPFRASNCRRPRFWFLCFDWIYVIGKNVRVCVLLEV